MIPVSSGKEHEEAELSPATLARLNGFTPCGVADIWLHLSLLLPASGLSDLACHHQRFMWTSDVWQRLLPLAGDSWLWGISPVHRSLSKVQGFGCI